MKKLDQSGFHAIWMLVVFVILIVISGGYFVYDRSANQSSNDNKSQVIDKTKSL